MERSRQLACLDAAYDVLVVGGGATGLGCAVDAACRGYRTALVEARDFAQGTSSRSTKLVHGGVRYLQQGNIGLVREALHERETLLRNAPHLAFERRFLVPAYSAWERPFYGIGLRAYDALAGTTTMERSRPIDAAAALELAPTLRRDGLRGGVLYSDGQFDDARLAISLARTACSLGATVVNGAAVRSFIKRDGRIAGATVVDEGTGAEYHVHAGVVINATGVFSDTVRRLDEPQAPRRLSVSQGIHLVLNRDFLPGDTAILVPRTSDGRVVFLIPWLGRTLAGTTDTPVDGPSVEPAPLDGEVDFVLETAGRYLTRRPSRADILSAFAGLRPLVRSGDRMTSALSRDHVLFVSRSGLVTITGGKWTTYRRMAEDAVDRAAQVAGLPPSPCQTASLRLYGADAAETPWRPFGAPPDEIARYEERYPGALHAALPYSLAMAAWTIEHEMPRGVEDVLSRRLRALYLDARAALEAAPKVAALMATLQGRDDEWVKGELEAFRCLAGRHLLGDG